MFSLKTNKIKYPKERGMYAFTKHRRGDFILFLKESSPGVLDFMVLPDRYTVSLTVEEFSTGCVTKILDFVEQLPSDVFEVAIANRLFLEKIS